jgi:hypothetical protein
VALVVLCPPLPGRDGLACPGEVEQVGVFGLVELKRACDIVQDGVGRADEISAFHPDVVVDAHAREQCHLLVPEPLQPAVAAVVGQPRPARGEIRSARDGGLADLGYP